MVSSPKGCPSAFVIRGTSDSFSLTSAQAQPQEKDLTAFRRPQVTSASRQVPPPCAVSAFLSAVPSLGVINIFGLPAQVGDTRVTFHVDTALGLAHVN